MLRPGLGNIANEPLEARPCVGLKLNFASALSSTRSLSASGQPLTNCTMRADPKELDRLDLYLWSLGLFIANFSVVERLMQQTLWHYAGIAAPTAPAVFTGIRTETAISLIGRIAEAQKWKEDRKREIQYVFSQLGMINRLRNDLLHYGATTELEEPEKWIISNEVFAHTADRVRRVPISPALLDGAAEDLYKISVHLHVVTMDDDVTADQLRKYHEVLQQPWRYKQPSPAPKSRKTRLAHPKRLRPPRS
jgi:hypothetical protein